MDTVDVRRIKGASVEVRMTDAEKLTFRDCAELSGLPLSGWIRSRLRAVAAEELKKVRKPVRFLKA